MKKSINTIVEESLDQEPKTTGQKAKINVLEAYHECLAQAYTVDGWVVYMENLINALVRDAVVNFDNLEQLRFKQGKIYALKELLSKSRKAFELSHKTQKVKSLEKKDAAVR